MKESNIEMVWQVDGYGRTAKDAAQEFARTHWAEARKITGFKTDGTFQLVRGLRTYRVVAEDGLWIVQVVNTTVEQPAAASGEEGGSE